MNINLKKVLNDSSGEDEAEPRQEEGNMYIYLKIFRGKLKAVAGLQVNKIISLGFLKESLPLLTKGGEKKS